MHDGREPSLVISFGDAAADFRVASIE